MLGSNYMNSRTVKLGGITVNVQPKPRAPYTVLKVTGLIDTGNGQQTVLLNNALPSVWEIDLADLPLREKENRRGLTLPRRIANLNCVYTGRSFGVVTDVLEAIKALSGHVKLAPIVPDVIAPGDFMLFKHEGSKMRIRFVGVIRAVPLAKAYDSECEADQ